ncbi:MAG: 30S ribosomal protein S20 [Lentisphaeraceae bacterium]|nr:30S ribosomal protein S20 [Lentisphaeraceae bacterium]
MAHNKSALKRIKQDEKKRLRNKARKRAVATYEKKFLTLVEEGKVAEAQEALKVCFSAYDKAAKKGVIKKEKADRKKSRLALRLNRAQA